MPEVSFADVPRVLDGNESGTKIDASADSNNGPTTESTVQDSASLRWHETKRVGDSVLPSGRWKEDLLDSFDISRTFVEKLYRSFEGGDAEADAEIPDKDEIDDWYLYCFEGDGQPPLVSILIQLDYVTCEEVLGHHILWLLSKDEPALGPHESVWLYALLTRIDMPLNPDAASNIRSLLVFCSNVRSLLERVDECDRDERWGERLACANVLIVLCGNYFDQEEKSRR